MYRRLNVVGMRRGEGGDTVVIASIDLLLTTGDRTNELPVARGFSQESLRL